MVVICISTRRTSLAGLRLKSPEGTTVW